DEVAEGEQRVERPAAREAELEETQIQAGRGHAGESILPAGPFGERIELDKVEDFRDRYRDHREIDAGAPQSDEADEIADGGRRDHADHEGRDDVRKAGAREQIGGDHSTRAIESRLPEGEQAGVAEEDVEADPEESPHQDAIHGV